MALHALIGAGPATIVEVGGHDGVTGSMSLYFEELGWPCLVVEPIPALAEAIRRRRTCIVVEAAADTTEGQADFLVPEGSETIATLDNENTAHSRIGEHTGAVSRIQVRTRRLDDILHDAGLDRADVVSVDVEGNELNVLNGFSLSRWNPRFLILEDNSFGRDQTVRRHLQHQGYRIMRVTGVNHWYCRADDPALTVLERTRCQAMLLAVRIFGIVTGRGRPSG
ncbi:FkbM family methyltransferase [Fodinicurvata sp. EGI_FJ10296]|uniref:FkbM family methyltransferase n=1 Tax=Fodinicurvata sp. EGI_FJ10296 TaxID=3231908 RepID=UPI003451BA20